jgi:hypothetical protein
LRRNNLPSLQLRAIEAFSASTTPAAKTLSFALAGSIAQEDFTRGQTAVDIQPVQRAAFLGDVDD